MAQTCTQWNITCVHYRNATELPYFSTVVLPTCFGTFLAIISQITYKQHMKSALSVHLYCKCVGTVMCCNSYDQEFQLVQYQLTVLQIYSSDTLWQLHRSRDIKTVWTCPDCKQHLMFQCHEPSGGHTALCSNGFCLLFLNNHYLNYK